jgi:hypothetical protein
MLVGGVPMQHVCEAFECQLPLVNIQELGSCAEEVAERVVREFLHQRIQPADEALFRVSLFRVSPHEHIFAILIHHLVMDGYAKILFFRELWSVYCDLTQRRAVSLSAVPMQYTDYALWQRDTNPQWEERHGCYWRGRLAGASPVRMPLRPPGSDTEPAPSLGDLVRFPKDLTEGLLRLATECAVPGGMISVALFAALVVVHCNQYDFVIPFDVNGRDRTTLNDVIGDFSQFLLLRVQCVETTTFAQLLKGAGREFSNAWSHVDHQRNVGIAPEFLRGACLQWASWRPDAIDGTRVPANWKNGGTPLELEVFPVGTGESSGESVGVDVGLGFWNSPEGIVISCGFSKDLDPRVTGEFIGSFQVISELVVGNPDLPLAALRDECPPWL